MESNERDAVLYETADVARGADRAREHLRAAPRSLHPDTGGRHDQFDRREVLRAAGPLYLVGRDGRIAYRGGPGPFGFVSAELERAVERHLADE